MSKSAFLAFAFSLMLAGTAPAGAADILRAKDFSDRFGVNIHLHYTDGGYANVGQVLSTLHYLGITHVRDQAPWTGMQPQGRTAIGQLLASGISFNFFVQGDMRDALKNMAALAQSYPRGLDSIEGPNEVNNFPVEWGGKKNHESAQGYQDALYARAKEYPLLAKLPVYNFTDYPSHAGKADHANIHPYPKGGQQPRQTIADNVAAELKVQPGRPWVITEGGYYTLPGPHGWGGLDESTHAKLMLNYYLDAIEQGAQRIYAYQLLDAYPDKPGTDQEKHFGFFDIQYKPKPAASAVRTLLMLVHDNGENAGSFTPEPLAYTIEGLPASARSLMLQKSDGWRFLVVWNEPAIWDNKQFKPMAAHGTEISIKLSEPRAIATVNDVIAGQQALATLAHTDTIPLHLTDTPLLVALSPQ